MVPRPPLDEIDARIAECKAAGISPAFAQWQRRYIIQSHAQRLRREQAVARRRAVISPSPAEENETR